MINYSKKMRAPMKNIGFGLFLLLALNLSDAKEIEALLEAADGGSKVALYDLGVRYGSGKEVKENNELANQYYERSASLGYAPAQNNLGWAYRQGIAVPKNPSKALYWFRLAALQGNALALQNLAEMYQMGEGVVRDLPTARSFFVLCATESIGEFFDREVGFNNAIHECRREVGKIDAIAADDDQKGLKRAAMWLTLALSKDKDVAKDSEIGLRARRSRKETAELLRKVNEKLDEKSKKWVKEMVKDWSTLRIAIKDRTPFPLVHEDCFNQEKSL
jgi:TPR repeat protein